jgi:hypothetical protein
MEISDITKEALRLLKIEPIETSGKQAEFTVDDLKMDFQKYTDEVIKPAIAAIQKKQWREAKKRWKHESKLTGIPYEIIAMQEIENWYK